jgi:hypothetical protein
MNPCNGSVYVAFPNSHYITFTYHLRIYKYIIFSYLDDMKYKEYLCMVQRTSKFIHPSIMV